jgi:hypothetical protein
MMLSVKSEELDQYDMFAVANRPVLDALGSLLASSQNDATGFDDVFESTAPAREVQLLGGPEQLAVLILLADENGLRYRNSNTAFSDRLVLEVPTRRHLQLIVSY